jgi:PhnB protein
MAAEKQGNPKGIQPLVPYIWVDDAAKAMDFYAKALGATEKARLTYPGTDKVMHGEMLVGGNTFMLGEAMKEHGQSTPKDLGGNHSSLLIYVPDVDASMEKAEKAGCQVTMPAEDMFWGDRMGALKDPFGHNWMLSTHKREVTPAEMEKAMQQMMAQGQGKK